MRQVHLITGNKALAGEITRHLESAGYEPMVTSSGPASADAVAVLYDLALGEPSKVGLPADMNPPARPVVAILKSAAELPQGVYADFIIAPFKADELVLRLEAAIARVASESAAIVRHGDLVINTESYEVTIGGESVELTYKEYELLRYLAGHPGRVCSRRALLTQIWEYDYFGGTRTVDVHIRRLRSKLGTKYGACIQTVRQVGYRFNENCLL